MRALFLSAILLLGLCCLVQGGDYVVQLRMPQIAHTQRDIRICTSQAIDRTTGTIVGFEHVGPPGVVHHMFAYGCAEPAGTTWECGHGGYKCRGSAGRLMYAWANDAPPLRLPNGVGFQLGSDLKYIVAEIHYGHESDVPDSSGMDIHITDRVLPFHAGLYVLMSSASVHIPENQPEFKTDINCAYRQAGMRAFAYRVHTHHAGTRVWAKKYDKGNRNNEILLGSRSPQEAQSFVPMEQEVAIVNGDFLKAQCIFNTTGKGPINIGAGMADEMCNFYIMGYSRNPISTIGCANGYEFTMS